jgi:hypothetical protein
MVLNSQDGNMGSIETLVNNPLLMISYYQLLLAIVVLVFLSTSVNLPLTLEPVCLLTADFSAPLTLSFFASLIFGPPLFWLVFPMLVILSPWYRMFLDQLKHFMCWFNDALRTIPAFIFICILRQYQEESQPPPPPPPAQVEIAPIENGANMVEP